MRTALLVLGAAASIAWAGQAAAQSVNGFEEAVRQGEIERKQREQEEQWRSSVARNAEASAAAVDQGRKIVASVNAMPVLPAARNPLFGKWMVEPSQRPKPREDDLIGQLSQLGGLTCRLMFSDGIITFRPGGWSLDDSAGDEDLGPVTYRSNGGVIGVVPAKGINALVFEVQSKDRLVELRTSMDEPCVLIRVPETTTYATRPRAGRPVTAVAARPASPNVATARATPAAPPSPAAASRSPEAIALRNSIDPRSLLGQAVALHQSGFEFQEALAKLLEAEKRTPNDPLVHAYLADTYRRLSMQPESKAHAERAIQLNPHAMEIFN